MEHFCVQHQFIEWGNETLCSTATLHVHGFGCSPPATLRGSMASEMITADWDPNGNHLLWYTISKTNICLHHTFTLILFVYVLTWSVILIDSGTCFEVEDAPFQKNSSQIIHSNIRVILQKYPCTCSLYQQLNKVSPLTFVISDRLSCTWCQMSEDIPVGASRITETHSVPLMFDVHLSDLLWNQTQTHTHTHTHTHKLQ